MDLTSLVFCNKKRETHDVIWHPLLATFSRYHSDYETEVAIFSSVSDMETFLTKQVNYSEPEVEKVTLYKHLKYLFMVCDISCLLCCSNSVANVENKSYKITIFFYCTLYMSLQNTSQVARLNRLNTDISKKYCNKDSAYQLRIIKCIACDICYILPLASLCIRKP